MDMTRIVNVGDARRIARRKLPRVVFDYVDGAADDEVTMHENETAFREVFFRPRMALGTTRPSLETEVLGTRVSIPVLLAPVGLVRLMHAEGPAGAARAATSSGTISILSTVAGSSPEEVASSGRSPRGQRGHMWFQLYAPDRETAKSLMDRAASSGYEALMVTVDTPALGNRERDLKNGGAAKLDVRTVLKLAPQVLSRPAWGVSIFRSGSRSPDAAAGHALSIGRRLGDALTVLVSPYTWDDVAWIVEQWDGPVLVKGILSGEDARRAVDVGTRAVVVSNHGGRQLDGAPATMRVLPEVVDAVGDRAEVYVDGGVRRGSDVVKALAVGARAVLIGRPFVYGLAAAGQVGVERVLEILRADMLRTMSLLGCADVKDLDRSYLQPLA